MHDDHGFLFWSLIPGLDHAPTHVVSAIFVAILLLVFTWIARLQLNRAIQGAEQGLIPEDRLTYRNFFEIIAEKLYAFVRNIIGEHGAATYFPLVGSLFLFIFASNVLGLIPGFLPPTDNLNTTLALGLFVFIYYNYLGLKSNGFNYLAHFVGPKLTKNPLLMVALIPTYHLLMLGIELVSHAVRPMSLGLRLRGNIMGDHMVLNIFNDLAGQFMMSTIFYGLGVFVCFIQAFVFCLLTMVYISLSTAHDH